MSAKPLTSLCMRTVSPATVCTIALFCCLTHGLAQPVRTGNLSTHIDSLIAAIPSGTGAGQYQSPSATDQSTWRSAVDAILQGDVAAAATMAGGLGYQILDFTDTADVPFSTHLVLEKTSTSTNYWGTYVFARSPRRPRLVIQSPHPLNDSKTGAQGFYVYRTAGALAFFMSGAHRCNSPLYSLCSGTTSTCGSEESYRKSDQAHVVDGMFQINTAALLEAIDSCVFIQCHGFAKLVTDPDIIMSNGTQKIPPAGSDYLQTLRDNLASIDASLTFKVGHIDTTWTRLMATQNVQGRFINGSTTPCTVPAKTSTGRFLHLEQKYAGLRDTKQNWNKLAQAVVRTFPETPTGVTGEHPSAFILFRNYPNPFNGTTTIVYDVSGEVQKNGISTTARVTLRVFDILGRMVAAFPDAPQWPGRHSVTFDAPNIPSGVYFAVLHTPVSARVISMLLLR
jgi:hypothetical protein